LTYVSDLHLHYFTHHVYAYLHSHTTLEKNLNKTPKWGAFFLNHKLRTYHL